MLSNHDVRAWLVATVPMVHQRGYRVTPVYESAKTQPYGADQAYPDPSASCWARAKYIGVVLDDAMLLDYDGNKASADKPIISLEALADRLGLVSLPNPVQRNQTGDSLHFLFQCPVGFNRKEYKQSNDGSWLTHIDIKWGNQLMILKPHKIISGGVLPDKSALLEAPGSLINALFKGTFNDTAITYDAALWDGTRGEIEEAREILKYIPPAEDYDGWLDVLMRIHDKFGATEAAFEIADEWSARANNYGGGDEVWRKFQSFRKREAVSDE